MSEDGMRTLVASVVAVLVVGCGVASGEDQGSDEERYDASEFPVVTCSVHYRPAVTQGFTAERELVLEPGTAHTAVDFEEVTIAFTYEYSEQEGGTLIVDERLPEDGDFEFFHRGLYQFVPRDAPTGETFEGAHGFTGLAYVQPPGSTAEAQYICVAEDDSSR